MSQRDNPPRSPLSGMWARTYQVGVVVRDMQEATRFYESLGIGPFVEGPSGHAIDRRVYEVPMPDAELAGRLATMGNVELELIQPIRGATIQREFLDNRGEGVIHLCAHTDDLARDTSYLRELGFKAISSGRFEDGGMFAYFDTRRVGGLVLELFQSGTHWK